MLKNAFGLILFGNHGILNMVGETMNLFPLMGSILFLLLDVMLVTAFAEESIYRENPLKKRLPLVTEFCVGIVSVIIVGVIALIKAPVGSDHLAAIQAAFFNCAIALFLLVLAILPVYLLGRYIYKHDFDKEPKALLIKLFLGGCGSILLTLVISGIMESMFPFFASSMSSVGTLIEIFIYMLIGVALVEEFSKWIFVKLIGYNNREFNHAYDAIVYAVFVSLGFACIENIMYVFVMGDSLLTALLRSVTAVPGHASFGVLMGYYLGLAKIAEKNGNKSLATRNKVMSVLVPTLVHGLYNTLAIGSSVMGELFWVFIVFVVFLFKAIPKKVTQLAAIKKGIDTTPQFVYAGVPTNTGMMMPMMSHPVQQPMANQVPLSMINSNGLSNNQVSVPTQRSYSYNYCPVCADTVMGNFCASCGHQHNKTNI